jgi:hypothetical protein
VTVLCDRLERLFRTADRARFTRPDGTVVPKFVYLDMEEYRDKELTAAAFMRTLDRDGLRHVTAGIALQSYIPDSFRTLRELQAWARRRVAGGHEECAQAVGQQGQIGFTGALHTGQVVLQHGLGVDQQAADQRALAVVDRAAGDEFQCVH